MKTHPQDGWPPDASPGEWLGWDAEGRLSVLRWCEPVTGSNGCGLHQPKPAGSWVGIRFDPRNAMPGYAPQLEQRTDGAQWPLGFRRGPDTESFVVKHRPAIGARGE